MQFRPLQEGNSCNLREGEGEIGSVEKINSSDPKYPKVIVEQRTPSILDQGSVVKIILKVSSSSPRNRALAPEIPEEYWHIFDQMANNLRQPQSSILQYSIVDKTFNARMKAIPLQNIPTFHGLTSEDPNAFLFEFDVLCRGYDYTIDPQKLKLFPSTMKGAALHWFLGLGGGTIND